MSLCGTQNVDFVTLSNQQVLSFFQILLNIIPRRDHIVLQYAVVVQLFNMKSGQLIFVHKIFLLLPL